MLGAIAGDVIGSFYEHHPIKSTEFPLFHEHSHFTDDSVMTVAVANAILENVDYGISMRDFGRKYPNAGYGGSFYLNFAHQSGPVLEGRMGTLIQDCRAMRIKSPPGRDGSRRLRGGC